ncbi:hypothetical protein K437DRAFT_268474 [Tilletiaria anomala UBC 951]|uniref:F-box domain-containing protein n=1 Tax=Tilletiaria anomala (strain ATCC 24038 / CBS 436.72 / UBC 951) TaxID=1037660 RepID=A0A066VU94_TILAU|nr:uncharacterized protein K437DRAFT_268474 [Tilletiaria anomala UBC 951]KDN45297.1 hypothetical protein K437DRAFT_268474 [Tilletiaria anomala UBC 951]
MMMLKALLALQNLSISSPRKRKAARLTDLPTTVITSIALKLNIVDLARLRLVCKNFDEDIQRSTILYLKARFPQHSGHCDVSSSWKSAWLALAQLQLGARDVDTIRTVDAKEKAISRQQLHHKRFEKSFPIGSKIFGPCATCNTVCCADCGRTTIQAEAHDWDASLSSLKKALKEHAIAKHVDRMLCDNCIVKPNYATLTAADAQSLYGIPRGILEEACLPDTIVVTHVEPREDTPLRWRQGERQGHGTAQGTRTDDHPRSHMADVVHVTSEYLHCEVAALASDLQGKKVPITLDCRESFIASRMRRSGYGEHTGHILPRPPPSCQTASSARPVPAATNGGGDGEQDEALAIAEALAFGTPDEGPWLLAGYDANAATDSSRL